MSHNRGNSSLRTKTRTENPMREYDRLPTELRLWLSTAILPWRAKSVRRAFDKALKRTGNKTQALKELDRLQRQRILKDTAEVWGTDYPAFHITMTEVKDRPTV